MITPGECFSWRMSSARIRVWQKDFHRSIPLVDSLWNSLTRLKKVTSQKKVKAYGGKSVIGRKLKAQQVHLVQILAFQAAVGLNWERE